MSKRAAEDTPVTATATATASAPTASSSGAAGAASASSSSSPSAQRAKRGTEADDSFSRAAAANGDEGMGEFEDQFEDELESEEEEDEGEEGMEIDGVRVDGEITRPEDDEDEDDNEPEEQVYLPGDKLEEGQTLEPDQSAYEMLHRLNVTWPCLSFDHLVDHLGSNRQKFPHTAYFAAGTQADVAKNNELMVMKASGMHKTQKDGTTSDDEEDDDDDDDGLDDDAILEYRSIPVLGGINRVRAAPVSAPSTSNVEPCLDPYPVAAWSEMGKVHIFDVRPLFNALDHPGAQYDKRKANMPMYTVEAHRGVEGYAMDWAGMASNGAGGQASSLRLLTGDLHSNIYLTTSNNAGFTTSPTPFASHTSSVEDLQWSPSETTVFASCSADCSVRVWDVRVKSRKSVIAVDKAHPQDVNVISWNRKTDYLLVSGGDEGGLNVWDLRNFKSNAAGGKPTPVASFQWHTAPISSVEWHPTEESVFAASGRDDQVTLWDLAVEQDEDEDASAAKYGPEGREVPSQLLFCHQGQQDIKEVHWHPQIPGALTTTALSGFNIFRTISV